MKKHLVTALMVLVVFTCSTLSKNVTENDNDPEIGLPKLFDIADLHSCSRTDRRYCELSIALKPKDPASHVWRYIETTINNTKKFDRSKLHRIICSTNKKIRKHETSIIMEKLKYSNFSAELNKIECGANFSMSLRDYIFCILFGLYLLLQIIATYYDLRQQQNTYKVDNSKVNQYLLAFSMATNWNKAISPKNNKDYNRLKCIQGIRIYNITMIVMMHVQLAWMQSNISSVYLVELLMESITLRTVSALSFFIVQTNFLISSWLLTNQINEIYKNRGYFSIRDALVVLINRYFRLLPGLLIMVLLMRLNLIYSYTMGPNNFLVMAMNYQACQQNWLTTLLMINNVHTFFADMCHPGSWYLAIDTQFYAATILFLYLKFKFNWSSGKAFFLLFIGSCLTYGLIIYTNNLNVWFQIDPDFFRYPKFFHDGSFYQQYLSFYSSWSTSIIGMILGTIYFHTKTKNFEFSRILGRTWVIIFIVCPIVALRLSILDLGYSPILCAILGPLLKPLYSFGIGIGIIGMVLSGKGLCKKICEWRYAVILSNFVFSVYISHFLLIFSQPFSKRSLLNERDVLKDTVVYTASAFIVGVIITILVEQPGFALQKLLLPQITYSQDKLAEANGFNKTNNIKEKDKVN